MTAEYQSVSGAVNLSSTPAVRYGYTELANGNNSRLTRPCLVNRISGRAPLTFYETP
jgi:hypothetical protein